MWWDYLKTGGLTALRWGEGGSHPHLPDQGIAQACGPSTYRGFILHPKGSCYPLCPLDWMLDV